MKTALRVLATIIPGGLIALAGYELYRYALRRRARREVREVMQSMGAPMPAQTVEA